MCDGGTETVCNKPGRACGPTINTTSSMDHINTGDLLGSRRQQAYAASALNAVSTQQTADEDARNSPVDSTTLHRVFRDGRHGLSIMLE